VAWRCALAGRGIAAARYWRRARCFGHRVGGEIRLQHSAEALFKVLGIEQAPIPRNIPVVAARGPDRIMVQAKRAQLGKPAVWVTRLLHQKTDGLMVRVDVSELL